MKHIVARACASRRTYVKLRALAPSRVRSPDGKTFYVSAGTLSVIDVPSCSVTGSVALGQTEPFRLGLSPKGSALIVNDNGLGSALSIAASGDGESLLASYAESAIDVGPTGRKIDVLDGASLRWLCSSIAGPQPSGIAIRAGGMQALVTDSLSSTVTVVDLPNAVATGTVNLGASSAGAVFID